MKTVGEAAQLAGITSETLRHYDRIGLLKPQARSEAGYRLYGRAELLRLREILVWRQLGFPLGDIAALLDDPDHDRTEALRHQHAIASAQRHRFGAITQGLSRAINALEQGRTLSEDELFADFAATFNDEEAPTWNEVERIEQATFASLSGRSHPHRRSGRRTEPQPPRLITTDPIRMAESLLALGIVPAGCGTYPDRFRAEASDLRGAWPWSPFVEPIVRRQIRSTGVYGLDSDAITDLDPDAIFGWQAPATTPLLEFAPLEMLAYRPPGFQTWLTEIATRLGLSARAERLLDCWQARTRALRVHLDGREVADLNVFGELPPETRMLCSTERSEGQVFTALGLRLVPPAGARNQWDWIVVDDGLLSELDAPTLFLGTFHVPDDEADALRSGRAFRSLPAVRHGRVFEQDWNGIRSGWFAANWQLRLISHAFGLTQLTAGDGDEQLFAAVDPRSGRLSIAANATGSVALSGPGIAPRPIDLSRDLTATVELTPDQAADLCSLPEAYSVSLGPLSHRQFVHDRESALARVAEASRFTAAHL